MEPNDALRRAIKHKTIIPAFNIPYLPMLEPVVQAVKDEDAVAMIQVARLEWEKFQAKSLEAVAKEYFRWHDECHTMLHLDHVPVIDEDHREVNYMPIMRRAAAAGYRSVMIDGSRMPLDGNIEATRRVTEYVHGKGIACEAELGSVAGHEIGGIGMSYEELFQSKKGFTDAGEARRFVSETGCDWLSVAAGSIHGAIAENLRRQKKPEARLDAGHIDTLRTATGGLPLVLHGGSGIRMEHIRQAIGNGIAKINIGTDIRQPYEAETEKNGNLGKAQDAVYDTTRRIIRDFLGAAGSRAMLYGQPD